MKKELWVTTPTNPFNPFTQMDRWINWDINQYEGVCMSLARLCEQYSTNGLSDSENESMIDRAVNELLDRGEGPGIPFYELEDKENDDGTYDYKHDDKGNRIVTCKWVHYVPAIEGECQDWGVSDVDAQSIKAK